MQVPKALQLPVVQKIVAGVALNRTGQNRTLRQFSRTGMDGTTPSLSGICIISASQTSGCLWIPVIVKNGNTLPQIYGNPMN